MDWPHRDLFASPLSRKNPCSLETALDMTLFGRIHERFADHAVAAAGRLALLVTGER